MALDPITAIISAATTVIDKIWPDANENEKAKLAQFMETLKLDLGQLDINKQEAAHASIFVAGWRPWIGWTCGAAFGWTYVVSPILNWILVATGHPQVVLSLSLNEMMPVLMGMLGLGAFRTYEKKNSLQDKH